MVSNPFKEQQKCFKWLDKFFKQMPASGIQEESLVIDCLLTFAVSEGSVKKCITRYVDVGILSKDKHGTLTYKEK